MKPFKHLRSAAAIFILTTTAGTPVLAQKVSMETASASSVVGLMPQSMAPIWSNTGLDIQLAMGQTLTKSLLKLGQGSLDTAVVPPPAYANLARGKGPYAKLGAEKAQHYPTMYVHCGGFPPPTITQSYGVIPVSMTGRASKESVFTQALPPALQMHKSRL